MLSTHKVSLLVVAIFWNFTTTATAENAKRNLAGQPPALEYLQLGHFGPISRLSSHPTFAHLGLTPRQSSAFVHILWQNGLLDPDSLRSANGEAAFGGTYLAPGARPAFFGSPVHVVDPYFLYLLTNYPRYLPFGLGQQGIYGSTGLPRPKPPGVFKYTDKN